MGWAANPSEPSRGNLGSATPSPPGPPNNLRIEAKERDLDERRKRELAARHWDYVRDYADARFSVVESIIARPAAHPIGSSRVTSGDKTGPVRLATVTWGTWSRAH